MAHRPDVLPVIATCVIVSQNAAERARWWATLTGR